MSGVSMYFGSGTEQLRSVAIFFTEFCVSYPNESEGTEVFGSDKRVIISMIN